MRSPAPRPALRFGTLLSLALLVTGCVSEIEGQLRRQVAQLEQNIEQKDRQLELQKASLDEMHQRLALARAIKPEELEKIFYPERIVIDSLSGGEDYDGQPGDDGVTVYLRPLDKDGDAIKVAGDIRIELYDLANEPGANRIAQYLFPVEDVRKHWYGKLLTYHYTLKCPWPPHGPPKHPEITIRATFADYLTQRVMTAQYVVTVRLPP